MSIQAHQEKRPRSHLWVRIEAPKTLHGLSSAWTDGRTLVTSSLADMGLPDGAGVGPQWIVAISHKRKRPNDRVVRRVLRDFDMVDAEEDNHYPGVTRGFFLVVDPEHRVDCECKVEEVTIREPDGFRWQNARDRARCRGCEYAALIGGPCPLHGPLEAGAR